VRVAVTTRRSYVPLIAVGIAVVVVGLVLGEGRGDDDTVINTVSAVLLTLGVLVVLAGAAIELVGRLRRRA
jgi:hypothetical protein